MSNRECKVRERGDDQHISVATTEAPLRHKADRTVIPGLWHVSHGYKQTHFISHQQASGGVEVDQQAFSYPQRQVVVSSRKVTSDPCSEYPHRYSEGHIIQALHALVHIHFFPLPQPSHPTQNPCQSQTISVARSMCQVTSLPPLGGSIILQTWE